MDLKMYTAEEVAQILRQRGDSLVTKRTVNYYAFEKNMFATDKTGKSCFSEVEIDKVYAIRLLQTYTKLKLDEIKDIINTKTPGEIIATFGYKAESKDTRVIKVNEEISLIISNKVNKDRLNKIISQINNIF